MRVKFTSYQLDYLNAYLPDEEIDLFIDFRSKDVEPLTFELNEELMDEIREWAIKKQILIGFDINYQLNDNGKLLESLIDLLYI